MLKKIIIATAILTIALPSFACVGGNLLQVIIDSNGKQLVIATYNINSGRLLAKHENYEIKGVVYNPEDSPAEEPLTSACEDETCTKLIDLENANINFTLASKNNETGKDLQRVLIKNISIGKSAPTSRSKPKHDLNLLEPIACSKK